MLSSRNHQIVRDFLAAMSGGAPLEDMVAPDLTAWTASSGAFEGSRFLGGVKLLRSIFSSPIVYHVRSLTAEEDRVGAEVDGTGTLITGEPYANRYMFLFRIADGKIASVAEHTDVGIVREKLGPLLAAAMAKTSGS